MMDPTQKKKNRLQWLYVFGGIFLANVFLMLILVIIAEKNKPQLVDKNYYQIGKLESYQKRIEQNQMSGWRPDISLHTANGQQVLALLVHDSSGVKVIGLTAEAKLYRPSNQNLDRNLGRFEELADSSYSLSLVPPIKHGYWNFLLLLKKGEFVFEDRIPLMIK